MFRTRKPIRPLLFRWFMTSVAYFLVSGVIYITAEVVLRTSKAPENSSETIMDVAEFVLFFPAKLHSELTGKRFPGGAVVFHLGFFLYGLGLQSLYFDLVPALRRTWTKKNETDYNEIATGPRDGAESEDGRQP